MVAVRRLKGCARFEKIIRYEKRAPVVDQDEAVKKLIEGTREEEWQPYQSDDGIRTDREIAETVHAMNWGKSAFRVIVLRWRERQRDLFKNIFRYHFTATGMVAETLGEVVWKYNERGQIKKSH